MSEQAYRVTMLDDGGCCIDGNPAGPRLLTKKETSALRHAMLTDDAVEFTADIPLPRLFLSDTVCVIRGQRYAITRLHDEEKQ